MEQLSSHHIQKADIRNGYVIPQESSVYRKSQKYELFRKQNLFRAVHSNEQIDAKFDHMVSRVLLKMDHRRISVYKKLCDLDGYLKQTAIFL